jgi:ADP-ribose pyrophosphatase YjhB (NUDIX family)
MVYTSEHPPFAVTADVVALASAGAELVVLLVTRGSEPYAGQFALPGGFVDPEEDLGDAARRELAEETGVSVPLTDLVQIGAYGRPGRDPRMRTVSIAYRVQLPAPAAATGGDDASDAGWHPVAEILRQPGTLAFDHEQILRDALGAARP